MGTLLPHRSSRSTGLSSRALVTAGALTGLLVSIVMIRLLMLPLTWEQRVLPFHLLMLLPSLLAATMAWRAWRQRGSDSPVDRAGRSLMLGLGSCLLAAHAIHMYTGLLEGAPVPGSAADAVHLLLFAGLLWGTAALERVQEVARTQNNRFRALVQHACDVITVIAPDTTISYQSPSAERLLGASSDSFTGTLYLNLVHPDDRERLFTCIAQALQHPEVPALGEWRVRHALGGWLHFEIYATNLQNDPAITGIILNARDITERKNLEEELKFRAFHDALTGLANRALFIDRVEQALVRTRRSGRGAALLFLDLDNFKLVNDLLGHGEGDRLLVEVAGRLRRCIRAADTVARFGGDEFAILLEDMTHPSDAALVAERVIRDLTIPLRSNGRDIVVSTSIGVAPVAGTESCDELMHHADSVMYLAKKHGRGRYEVFDAALHNDVARRLAMEADFRRAMEMNEMVVHYRPVVSLGSQRIAAVEAVLRWHHPKKGLLEADSFLEIAQGTRQILLLGEWLLEASCRQLRAWHLLYPGTTPVSGIVPLFAEQLADSQFAARLRYVLQRTGIRPDNLVLELPESVAIEQPAATVQQLLELKALGIRLSVAKRGGTLSSLHYLRRLRVDFLKLNGQCLDEVTSREQVSEMSTLLAHDPVARVKIVVEGVEDGAQVERLQHLGFDLAQGSHFADPMRKEVLEGLLKDGGSLAPATLVETAA